MKVATELAGIGGLVPCDESSYPYLSDLIEPRYIWIKEQEPPEDRLPARHKVILELGRFKELMHAKPWPTFEVAGKIFGMLSYYGETMHAQ